MNDPEHPAFALLVAIAEANGHEDGSAWADKVIARLEANAAAPPAPPADGDENDGSGSSA